ncbi:hypothetical protein E2C01_094669 [Portunus trituberculatus]|uniref:Uncharacterized protein n=1 Tax=Portunus trituberculatus TaxID=210409 RepID=A0A5B7JXH4_PORTR|nr:hypothetical protein [Portunus trituberculatus]
MKRKRECYCHIIITHTRFTVHSTLLINIPTLLLRHYGHHSIITPLPSLHNSPLHPTPLFSHTPRSAHSH